MGILTDKLGYDPDLELEKAGMRERIAFVLLNPLDEDARAKLRRWAFECGHPVVGELTVQLEAAWHRLSGRPGSISYRWSVGEIDELASYESLADDPGWEHETRLLVAAQRKLLERYSELTGERPMLDSMLDGLVASLRRHVERRIRTGESTRTTQPA